MISPGLQTRVIETLKMLEFDGAPLVNADPPHCRFIYRFRGGVPFILLRAWLEALPMDLSDTLALSLRRELVTEHTCHLFRSLLPKRRRANAQ